MAKKILAKEAIVRPAKVELQIISISGKQMTLAVFRQLEVENVINSELQIQGKLWGRVNYCWSICDRSPSHIHVIWQKDDELRQCVIPKEWWYSCYKDRCENEFEIQAGKEFTNKLVGLKEAFQFYKDQANRGETWEQFRYHCWYPNAKEISITKDQFNKISSLLKETDEKVKKQKEEIENRYRSVIKIINNLPQLFIAV
jgi:hypothetical protein